MDCSAKTPRREGVKTAQRDGRPLCAAAAPREQRIFPQVNGGVKERSGGWRDVSDVTTFACVIGRLMRTLRLSAVALIGAQCSCQKYSITLCTTRLALVQSLYLTLGNPDRTRNMLFAFP
jgi:hypothetical protein